MSDHIPGEILIQILARLPVKSLIKFRCVSKSWYCLISSPDFINTHLSLNNTNNNKFLFFKHTVLNYWGEDECIFSLNHEDSFDEYACFGFLDKHGRFEDSFKSRYRDFKIFGSCSCNGLVCVWSYLDIILWNPSINKYVTLPTPEITYCMDRPVTCVVGFGFDNRANDYKVVRVVCEFSYPKVELCELSKGSWRDISCNAPPYLFKGCKSQAYINGVVHWIAYDSRNGYRTLIVAFDMVDEVFREMALPDSYASIVNVWEDMSIGTVEESLVVVLVYHLRESPSNYQRRCSVWVMKEYGVAKSWVNQFNIVLDDGLNNVQSLMKNGELLLGTTSGQLVLYNSKDQQMINVEFPSSTSFYVDTYMESLILLKGMQTDSCNAVIWRKEDEIEEHQDPTILEEAKTNKKIRVEIGVGSSKS